MQDYERQMCQLTAMEWQLFLQLAHRPKSTLSRGTSPPLGISAADVASVFRTLDHLELVGTNSQAWYLREPGLALAAQVRPSSQAVQALPSKERFTLIAFYFYPGVDEQLDIANVADHADMAIEVALRCVRQLTDEGILISPDSDECRFSKLGRTKVAALLNQIAGELDLRQSPRKPVTHESSNHPDFLTFVAKGIEESRQAELDKQIAKLSKEEKMHLLGMTGFKNPETDIESYDLRAVIPNPVHSVLNSLKSKALVEFVPVIGGRAAWRFTHHALRLLPALQRWAETEAQKTASHSSGDPIMDLAVATVQNDLSKISAEADKLRAEADERLGAQRGAAEAFNPPDERTKHYLIEAYSVRPFDEASFNWEKIAAAVGIPASEAFDFGRQLIRLDLLTKMEGDQAFLSDKAKAFFLETKAAESHIDFSDSRRRHFFAFLYPGILGSDKRSFTPAFVGERVGLTHSRPGSETDAFTTMLWREGYIVIRYDGSALLTERGKEVARRFYEAAVAKQQPQEDGFSKRWTDHQTEGERFLVWAWKQYKGDLKRPVDARRYGIDKKRNRYDIVTIVDWVVEHKWMEIPKEQWVNEHVKQFWDEPLNTVIPYGYFVRFTREGAIEAIRLMKARRHRFLGFWSSAQSFAATVASVIIGLPTLIAAIIAIRSYLKTDAPTPTPSPASQPTTRFVPSEAAKAAVTDAEEERMRNDKGSK